MKTIKEIESCNSCNNRKDLFESLDEAELQAVNDTRKELIFKRGDVIRKEGDPINSFLYLRSGLIKLYKTDKKGKDHILSISKPGDLISLLSIFSNSVYKYSIAAIEETKVCDIELSTFQNVIRSNSSFTLRILNGISRISDNIIENQFEIRQRQVKGRNGKPVVLVTGLPLAASELKLFAKKLKSKCGVGGSINGSTIIIQGDKRDQLKQELQAMGYQVKLSGG